MKQLFSTLVLILLACSLRAAGGNFSYLYIQGDKQTPFYVKMDDAMQPRYGKNYCILPRLAPGPLHLEILFQQNAFPAQKFTILIPEGGSRGFLLVRADAGFMLYDLQQGFYLPAGNKAEQDRLPEVVGAVTRPAPGAVADPAAEAYIEPVRTEEPVAAQPKTVLKNKTPEKAATPAVTQPEETKPVFINDIEFSKGQSKSSEPRMGGNSGQPAAITNTDCPAPISAADFGKVFSAVSRLTTDEDRIEFLGGKMDLCYETWQARALAGRLEADVARYELLRKIYPRISDQAAFPLLDDLLTTDTWKAEFNRLVHR